MIKIKFNSVEVFSENGGFKVLPTKVFRFEHCLKAIATWETAYGKPFLNTKKTTQEGIDYCYYMCLDSNFDIAYLLSPDNESAVKALIDYMQKPNCAFRSKQKQGKPGQKKKRVTAEDLYASIALAQLHISAEKWPLNRLMGVLELISDANDPKKNKKRKRDGTASMINANERKLKGL